MFCTSLPPLINDKCFLTQLNSSIVAPHSNNNFVTRFFSLNVILSGSANSEEPPPDTKNNTKSCFEQLLIKSNTYFPAFTLSTSGSGCPE